MNPRIMGYKIQQLLQEFWKYSAGQVASAVIKKKRVNVSGG